MGSQACITYAGHAVAIGIILGLKVSSAVPADPERSHCL